MDQRIIEVLRLVAIFQQLWQPAEQRKVKRISHQRHQTESAIVASHRQLHHHRVSQAARALVSCSRIEYEDRKREEGGSKYKGGGREEERSKRTKRVVATVGGLLTSDRSERMARASLVGRDKTVPLSAQPRPRICSTTLGTIDARHTSHAPPVA